MYNAELKERYIQEKESTTVTSPHFLHGIFNKSNEFEEELEKDICNFTTYEIINYYKTLNIGSIDSLYVLNSSYSLYVQWCLQQNLVFDSQNHFLEFTREQLKLYVNKVSIKSSIITREALYKYLDELPNPSDAFILIALFEGLGGKCYEEIWKATIADLNGNEFTTCTGRKIKVSDKFVSLATLSNETLEYQAITGKMERSIQFKDEDLIVKNQCNAKDFASDRQKGRRIYFRIKRTMDYLGLPASANGNDFVISGIIDMVNTNSRKLGIDAEEYIKRNLSNISERYGKNIIPSKFIIDYREYLE